MGVITYAQLQRLSDTVPNKGLLMQSAAREFRAKTVFLSHSSGDHQYVVGVIKLLEQHGASVYIDDADSGLPDKPSRATADSLKTVIKACPRFVVIVSPNSYKSVWVPWELGLADADKGTAPIATLPISPTSSEQPWVTHEYLGLYPHIYYAENQQSYCVHDPRDNKSWQLTKWLTAQVK
jgi:hypothetical protein